MGIEIQQCKPRFRARKAGSVEKISGPDADLEMIG
jgi:hypothetical protein